MEVPRKSHGTDTADRDLDLDLDLNQDLNNSASLKSTESGLVRRASSIAPGKEAKPNVNTKPTWEAYSLAYSKRYGSKPVRNRSMNSRMKDFVRRIGVDESPHVAAFYVTHNDPWYVRQGHAVGILLQNAEKIRTEWVTNRKITTGDARSAEMFDEFSAKSRRIEKLIEKMDGKK